MPVTLRGFKSTMMTLSGELVMKLAKPDGAADFFGIDVNEGARPSVTWINPPAGTIAGEGQVLFCLRLARFLFKRNSDATFTMLAGSDNYAGGGAHFYESGTDPADSSYQFNLARPGPNTNSYRYGIHLRSKGSDARNLRITDISIVDPFWVYGGTFTLRSGATPVFFNNDINYEFWVLYWRHLT